MHRFRETVEIELGKEKGMLGKAVDEALNRWMYEKQQEEIAHRQKNLMMKGFSMGKLPKFSREELYDRT